jgi:tRNA pseudouridine55 synthase
MTEDGIILIDKPTGITSFGVVARVRRQLSEHYGHKMKVGHTGTLDPFATGLMILVVGQECKRAADYSKLDKIYEASMCLGQTSSTGDPEGEFVAVSGRVPTEQEIVVILKKFTSEITQTPPQFSAIKVGGQRAYKLARAGKTFEIPARKVTVFNLDLLEYNYPNLKLRAHVSSGTYIRTLAEDIGKELGVGAYCTDLRRTNIGHRTLDDVDAKFQLAT